MTKLSKLVMITQKYDKYQRPAKNPSDRNDPVIFLLIEMLQCYFSIPTALWIGEFCSVNLLCQVTLGE